jgi:hypothetical protein
MHEEMTRSEAQTCKQNASGVKTTDAIALSNLSPPIPSPLFTVSLLTDYLPSTWFYMRLESSAPDSYWRVLSVSGTPSGVPKV